MLFLVAPYLLLNSSQWHSYYVYISGINCYMPANGETSTIATHHNIPLDTALNLLKRQNVAAEGGDDPDPKHPKILHGALMMKGSVSGLLYFFLS